MLDLHCCGLSLVAVHGLLIAVASLVVVHRLIVPWHVFHVLPRPEVEPVSPPLQDGFLTTGPPGKSHAY